MKIQNRLLLEQIGLWADSQLGRSILKGKQPKTVEEFRRMVPLTTYEDYADVLLFEAGRHAAGEASDLVKTTWKAAGTRQAGPYPYGAWWIAFRDNVVAWRAAVHQPGQGPVQNPPSR